MAGMIKFIRIFTLKIAQRFDEGDDFYRVCLLRWCLGVRYSQFLVEEGFSRFSGTRPCWYNFYSLCSRYCVVASSFLMYDLYHIFVKYKNKEAV
jgi:hypothetical protein